jgi:penicillin amidase
MFVALQGRQAWFEQTVEQLHQSLPEPLARFLTQAGSDWETPVSGPALERPPVPGPDVIDLRAIDEGSRGGSTQKGSNDERSKHVRVRPPGCVPNLQFAAIPCVSADEESVIGSNNWAVDGAHAGGAALIANDMHLALSVPNIWYRAVMVFPDPADPITSQQLAGVTMPGLPSIVVGSNGYVAWGFTNSGGDWSDLVRIEPDPRDPSSYLTPDGPQRFDVVSETIKVSGEADRSFSVRSTRWGPVVWRDPDGRDYAQHWVAHDPEVIASDLTVIERPRTIDEAVIAAASLGIPHQNLTMVDRSGRIAWTIAGRIPARHGFDGFRPQSWADGQRGWKGYLDASLYPRVVDPEGGRLWTANAPVVGGSRLQTLGDGGYADGIRARIIRDRLFAIDRATPDAMQALQLENQARFLDRWRKLLLEVFETSAARDGDSGALAARAEFRALIDTTWTGAASPESIAYPLVKTFRANVVRTVMTFVTGVAAQKDASFDYTRSPRSEGPVWQLVTTRPLHLLDPSYKTWDHLLVAAVDKTVRELTEGGRTLAARTWGDINRAEISHPLASTVPVFHGWLKMPADPLPGDVFTPRAQSPRTGPSERMVVSPGRESEGLLHMPTGQSAHPLSPHFSDMQRAWVNGDLVPFLPGPAQQVLVLEPRQP